MRHLVLSHPMLVELRQIIKRQARLKPSKYWVIHSACERCAGQPRTWSLLETQLMFERVQSASFALNVVRPSLAHASYEGSVLGQ